MQIAGPFNSLSKLVSKQLIKLFALMHINVVLLFHSLISPSLE